MISFTKLLGTSSSYGDGLRYHRAAEKAARRPIVVWSMTRRCNLACCHCYSDSCNKEYPGELSTAEALGMIENLRAYGVPVLLFSGGEPLLREDLFVCNAAARAAGLRTVISTNGTLITPELAQKIKEAGFVYVGVSLDGVREKNDYFRGRKGAFDAALAGIRALSAVGQKVGLRFTMTRHNAADLPSLFQLVEEEHIDRVCFYHLAYAGRGAALSVDALTPRETRIVIDRIRDWTLDLSRSGVPKEVLTVDNHADGVYLYLGLLKTNPARAQQVHDLLLANGGNASGIAIANIDSQGFVHPDQFSPDIVFGNIRERSFESLWTDLSNTTLQGFKERQGLLKGRCGRCVHVALCNGGLRSRALAASGDLWQEDPACYLTEEEIQQP